MKAVSGYTPRQPGCPINISLRPGRIDTSFPHLSQIVTAKRSMGRLPACMWHCVLLAVSRILVTSYRCGGARELRAVQSSTKLAQLRGL